MKRITALALSLVLAGGVFAAQAQQATPTTTTKSKKVVAKKSESTVSSQLGEMKQAIEAQQRQIAGDAEE